VGENLPASVAAIAMHRGIVGVESAASLFAGFGASHTKGVAEVVDDSGGLVGRLAHLRVSLADDANLPPRIANVNKEMHDEEQKK
jgi:hypothetical protein